MRLRKKLKSPLIISQVDGGEMRIAGMAWPHLSFGGAKWNHKLYAAPEMSSDLILGEYWLKRYKAHLKFEPATLTVVT